MHTVEQASVVPTVWSECLHKRRRKQIWPLTKGFDAGFHQLIHTGWLIRWNALHLFLLHCSPQPLLPPHLIFHSSLWSLSFSVWKRGNAMRGKGNRINKAENGSDVRGVAGFSFSSKADKSWSHMDNTVDKTHPEKNKVHKRKKNQRSIGTVLRQQ